MARRRGHGEVVGDTHTARFSPFGGMRVAAQLPQYGYMFSKEMPPVGERLADGEQTVRALTALGQAMSDAGEGDPKTDPNELSRPGDGSIPAAYTYFGQFVDHDITLDDNSASLIRLTEPSLVALDPRDIAGLMNGRTAMLELDSVYGTAAEPTPKDPPRLIVGEVTKVTDGTRRLEVVPGKGVFNDVPREDFSDDPKIDRAGKIGDPRNDENLIVAQMHVAFLKAHNTLASLLGSFEEARAALTRIYQSVILDDYLPRICDPAVVNDVTQNGPKFFKPEPGAHFMPLEFSAAGFRFGHSMIRSQYNFNLNFDPFGSQFMFVFTALTGQVGGTKTFPDNWIIQWERWLSIDGSTPQRARPIDARLTTVLFRLQNTLGEVVEQPDPNPDGTIPTHPPEFRDIAPHLARRNLLRGYLLGLPTGQTVAAKLGIPALTPDDIRQAVAPANQAAVEPFVNQTPLWFYLLAEAGKNGGRLGLVGGRIVAETLHTLVRSSTPSILNADGSRAMTTKYKLADIIALADKQDQLVGA